MEERQDLVKSILREIRTTRDSEPQRQEVASEEDGWTYAAVARRRRGPRKNTKTVLLTYPKNAESSSDDTKEFVRKEIAVVSDDRQIHKIARIKNGGVAIELRDSAQADTVRDLLQKNKEYEVVEPKLRQPKLMVYDLPSEVGPDEVKDVIYEKNLRQRGISRDDYSHSTKLLYRTGPKGEERCNWVFETSREIRRILLDEGRIFFHLVSVQVVPFQLVTRCFKCQRYGHMSKHCIAE